MVHEKANFPRSSQLWKAFKSARRAGEHWRGPIGGSKMIHPGATLFKREPSIRASRLRLAMLVAVVSAFAAFTPSSASANVTNAVTQTFGSNVPGAHGDYTIEQTFPTYTG